MITSKTLPDEESKAILIHTLDSVAVALSDIEAGAYLIIKGQAITCNEAIMRGHKIAIRAHESGDLLYKYGHPIGRAIAPIAPGDWVHNHNLRSNLDYGIHDDSQEYNQPIKSFSITNDKTIKAYRRHDGAIGIRNQLFIIPLVGCVTRTAERLANWARHKFSDDIDDAIALTHPHGCSQTGTDLESTKLLLSALACHPNAGGVLVIGLGCETNRLDAFLDAIDNHRPLPRDRLKYFSAQTAENEIETGQSAIHELVKIMKNDHRTDALMSEVCIGLKCGGSDGFSGLTANPLMGRLTDIHTKNGGTSLLTEIPEIFGAEHLLAARSQSETIGHQIINLVADFKQRFAKAGEGLSDNPSPGNKQGGITTLEEKSLGAVQKGGQSPITEVMRYGERTTKPGLGLLEAPGNDAVSTTALAAAGAHLILFSTGRGTPLGTIVPTMKLSSQSELYQHKPSWIDFDCGAYLNEKERDQLIDELEAKIIACANGERLKNEINEEQSISLWKQGVTL